MTFAAAVKSVFSNYATFTGRARRAEYWFFALFNVLVVVALLVVSLFLAIPLAGVVADAGAELFGEGGGFALSYLIVLCLLVLLYYLAVLLPCLAVAVRRLHDLNVSGWWLLLLIALECIPYIGILVSIGQIVWFAQKGTSGDNRFGPDPLAADVPAAA